MFGKMLFLTMQEAFTAKTASTLRTAARKPRSKADKAKDLALGKRIAALRKERGYTQVDLADQLGVIQAIDGLPKRDQDALFRTIDVFVQARRAS